jgi:hypothetical protein
MALALVLATLMVTCVSCAAGPGATRRVEADDLDRILVKNMTIDQAFDALGIPPGTPRTYVGTLSDGISTARSPLFPDQPIILHISTVHKAPTVVGWSIERTVAP